MTSLRICLQCSVGEWIICINYVTPLMNYEWHKKFTSHSTFHNHHYCIRESNKVSRRVLVRPNEFQRPHDVGWLTYWCKMSRASEYLLEMQIVWQNPTSSLTKLLIGWLSFKQGFSLVDESDHTLMTQWHMIHHQEWSCDDMFILSWCMVTPDIRFTNMAINHMRSSLG